MLPEIERQEETQNSVQALAAFALSASDMLFCQGEWHAAVASWRRALIHSQRDAVLNASGMLAAAASGDAAELAAIQAELPSATPIDLPVGLGLRATGETLAALLAGQWDVARTAYRRAVASLEPAGYRTTLARLQLAVGHRAAGRFPEAAEAAEAAGSYFRERGADSVFATYEMKAVGGDPPGSPRAGRAVRPAAGRSEVPGEG